MQALALDGPFSFSGGAGTEPEYKCAKSSPTTDTRLGATQQAVQRGAQATCEDAGDRLDVAVQRPPSSERERLDGRRSQIDPKRHAVRRVAAIQSIAIKRSASQRSCSPNSCPSHVRLARRVIQLSHSWILRALVLARKGL